MFCKALASSAKEYQVPAIIYFWLVSPLGRYVFIDIITTLLEKKNMAGFKSLQNFFLFGLGQIIHFQWVKNVHQYPGHSVVIRTRNNIC